MPENTGKENHDRFTCVCIYGPDECICHPKDISEYELKWFPPKFINYNWWEEMPSRNIDFYRRSSDA